MKKLTLLLLTTLLLCSCETTQTVTPVRNYSQEAYDYMLTVPIIGDNGVWLKEYYVDEFGYKTKDGLICTSITNGRFSNSATNGSSLTGLIIIDEKKASFQLKEYGWSLPYISDSKNITISMNINGERYELGKGTFNEETKRIFIKDKKTLYEAMVNNSSVRILINVNSEYGSPSSYIFDIPTAGFEKTYYDMFIKK